MSLATFATQALADFQSTAAIAPSSLFLVEAMTEPLPLETAKTVVELGPGTGVMTRRILGRLPADARLLAFEINPRFVEYLRDVIDDPRLEIVEAGAETLGHELEQRRIEQVDGALSSLGLALMPAELVDGILTALTSRLSAGAAFTQFQYVSRIRIADGTITAFDAKKALGRFFGQIDRRVIVRNLPPAFVYACRGPRAE